jgi:16S rRNA (cytosine967-C5)-methyltransferase
MGVSLIIILLALIFEWSYVEAFIFYKQPTHIRCGTSSISNRRTHHIITTQLHSTTADADKTNKPSKSSNKSSPKRGVQATSRSVAITALANAAASAYNSSSSSGAGAQVNAGSFATRELEQDNNYKELEGRDRSFARLLVATVERRLGQIDGVLSNCCNKYPKGKHRHLAQATLRAGAAQLLFLKTPTFAVVKETVEVLRIHHKLTNSSPVPVPEPIIKFVNGVLRKLSATVSTQDNDEVLYALQLLDEKTSLRDNIAPWLLDRWEEDWGIETTRLICEEIMPRDERSITPHIDLTTKYLAAGLNKDNEDVYTLIENLGNNARILPQGSIRADSGGDITTWHDFDKGTWWVQDVAATLPALVLSKALHDKHSDLSNLRVVDMCSAPGGKTSQLLSAGFEHVTAIEANARRSRRLKENLERLRFDKDKYDVVVEEGQKWIPSNAISGILVDVPCSATGTGKKRPDVLRRESDITDLLNIQEVLATHCAEILPQGGIMVYATW